MDIWKIKPEFYLRIQYPTFKNVTLYILLKMVKLWSKEHLHKLNMILYNQNKMNRNNILILNLKNPIIQKNQIKNKT